MTFERRVNRIEDAANASCIGVVVQRAELFEDKENGNHQAKIAYDIDDQGLFCRRHRGTSLIPEADEEE